MIDDRALSGILKEIQDTDIEGLLGTGYDEQMLANLILVTRNADEIVDFNAAAHWVGLPEYEQTSDALQAVLRFETDEQRAEALALLGIDATYTTRKGRIIAAWWPPRERQDSASVKFVS